MDEGPPARKYTTTVSTDLAAAAQWLAQGEVVGIPTETVYGLAANALDPDAVSLVLPRCPLSHGAIPGHQDLSGEASVGFHTPFALDTLTQPPFPLYPFRLVHSLNAL
jgi:hypothetical protein